MNTITAKELAMVVGTDPKSMRRFIRSFAQTDDGAAIIPPGSGGRYGFSPDEARTIRDAFTARPTASRSAGPMRSVEDLEALLDIASEEDLMDLDEDIEDLDEDNLEV